MVTPKRVVETTPLVVAQTERLKRSLELGTRRPASVPGRALPGPEHALERP